MQGVPTTVSVSGAFLKKCMNDPEKAKYLEENLAALPDCASYAVSHAQGTLTSISYEIDANGNITGISSGTNDPDGKIAREKREDGRYVHGICYWHGCEKRYTEYCCGGIRHIVTHRGQF